MSMNADFQDAHARHWEDAEHLFRTQRWANADHLYGVAAECGLKALMLVFGMPFDQEKNRPRKSEDRAHANGLWTRYEAYICGFQGGGYDLQAENPFSDWDISDRYAHRAQFDAQHTAVHRAGAEQVSCLVRQAQIQGLLP